MFSTLIWSVSNCHLDNVIIFDFKLNKQKKERKENSEINLAFKRQFKIGINNWKSNIRQNENRNGVDYFNINKFDISFEAKKTCVKDGPP